MGGRSSDVNKLKTCTYTNGIKKIDNSETTCYAGILNKPVVELARELQVYRQQLCQLSSGDRRTAAIDSADDWTANAARLPQPRCLTIRVAYSLPLASQ